MPSLRLAKGICFNDKHHPLRRVHSVGYLPALNGDRILKPVLALIAMIVGSIGMGWGIVGGSRENPLAGGVIILLILLGIAAGAALRLLTSR